MKNQYNFEEEIPKLSQKQILQHQDFDALFAAYEAEEKKRNKEVETINRYNNWRKYLVGIGLSSFVAFLLLVGLKAIFKTEESSLDSEVMEPIKKNKGKLLEQVDKAFTILNLETQVDKTLDLDGGLRLFLPKNAFRTIEGELILENVELSYRQLTQDPLTKKSAEIKEKVEGAQQFIELKGSYQGQELLLNKQLILSFSEPKSTELIKLFSFDVQTEVWEESTEFKVSTNLEEKRIAYRAIVEKKLGESPVQPIQPLAKIDNSLEAFNIDFNKRDFPELAVCDGLVFLVKKEQLNQEDILWSDMRLEKQGVNRYDILLSSEEDAIELRLENVLPRRSSSEKELKKYRAELEVYKNKLQQRTKEIEREMDIWEDAQQREKGIFLERLGAYLIVH